MKHLIIGLIVLFQINNALAYDINEIRADYIEAINNSEKADELYKELTSLKSRDALVMAYLGSTIAVKAKHEWNPVNKLSYIKQAFRILNEAVEKAPNQLEVRFLRFTLEHYVPEFLGYSKNINQDKAKVIDLVKKSNVQSLKIDAKILRDMVNFMIDSKRCSPNEVAVLQKVLS